MKTACRKIAKAHGYTCFAPDYTLSGSAPYPAANQDLLDAVAYIHAQGFSQIGALGFSAGGNLVAWLADQDLFVTSVTWSGPMDLETILAQGCACKNEVNRFAPTAQSKHDASAVFGVNDAMGSMLIVNSANELIPIANAQEEDAAVPTEHRLAVIPGTKHGGQYYSIEEPETIAWFAAHL
jgi:dienelactone hydrolase